MGRGLGGPGSRAPGGRGGAGRGSRTPWTGEVEEPKVGQATRLRTCSRRSLGSESQEAGFSPGTRAAMAWASASAVTQAVSDPPASFAKAGLESESEPSAFAGSSERTGSLRGSESLIDRIPEDRQHLARPALSVRPRVPGFPAGRWVRTAAEGRETHRLEELHQERAPSRTPGEGQRQTPRRGCRGGLRPRPR